MRNSWVTKPNKEEAGYIDKAEWEKIKEEGDDAIREWIADNMKGTSVTVVLIGTETSSRDWVKYEVQKSHDDKKGMLGIYIHNIKDKNKKTCSKGSNQFGPIDEDENGNPVYFWQIYPTYDWVDDDGYNNLGDWVEAAAKAANR